MHDDELIAPKGIPDGVLVLLKRTQAWWVLNRGKPLALMAETAILTIILVAIAAIVYSPVVIHGGFVTDPWVVKGWYQMTPNHDVFSLGKAYIEYNGIGFSRSLDFIRLAMQSAVLGWNMHVWIAWQLAMCVIMSASLFVLLRRLHIQPVHAALIAILVLIFPAASSIRIWPIMGSPAAITLTIGGFLVALKAFEASGWRRFLLHGISVSLFVASALLYEAAFAVMFFSVLVYCLRVPWRPALRRWGFDVAVLSVVAVILQAHASVRGHQTLSGMISHATVIADQTLSLFTTVALPLSGINRWLVLGLLALIPIAAITAIRWEPLSDGARRLRFWLTVLAAGLVVIVLGYISYVPADNFYEPLSPGIGNRVNGVTQIGFVLVMYALAMLGGVLVVTRSSRLRSLSTVVGIGLLGAVSVVWVHSNRHEESAFIQAYRAENGVIRSVRTAIPTPGSGSTIWAFGFPFQVAPGVPIFDQFGNFASRLRLSYNDVTLTGFIAAPGTEFECGSSSIIPQAGNSGAGPSAYGHTYFIDVSSGRSELIRSPAQCRRAAASFPRMTYLPGESSS